MPQARPDGQVMTIAEEFALAREAANHAALYTTAAVPPNTCRYCGAYWHPFNGSALDGHAKCLISTEFQRRLALVPGPQLKLAAQLGVTLSVLRAWIAPRRSST